MNCAFCQEPILPGEAVSRAVIHVDGEARRAHPECGVRMALGGIGHHVDHDYWCTTMGDPDMGLSYRESARRVAILVRGDET